MINHLGEYELILIFNQRLDKIIKDSALLIIP